MYAQVEKSKENRSRAVANSVTQKKSNVKQEFGFVDNRPNASIQRTIQKIANEFSSNGDQKAIQKKAIKATRPLAQAENETASTNHLINGRGVFHHAHIIFDRGYHLPIVGASDNVGYHAVNGASGPGELFREQVHTRGYSNKVEISSDSYHDRLLIQSIDRFKHFGEYKLGRHDCQSWVKAVEADYRNSKDDGVEMLTREERDRDTDANRSVKLENLHARNPDGIELM